MGATEQAVALLQWAEQHWNDRMLPWRSPSEPMGRRALVEGLLAQTRADAVARAYVSIFDGVQVFLDWLSLGSDEKRLARVAPLGLGAMKLRAVSGIAEVLHCVECGEIPRELIPVRLEAQPGVGPYTAAMVAALYGFPGVPVDTNVGRVGRRVDPTVTPAIWIGEVLEAAAQIGAGDGPSDGNGPIFAAPYVVISMVLDVGAGPCAAGQYPECQRCPLAEQCWYAQHGKVQRLLPL